MSELKATTVYDAYWTANSVGEGTGIQVYLKSEADKVIAHHKHKRCVAMSNWCLTEKVYFHYRYDDWGDKGYDRPYKWKKVVFWGKWARRWLKIAEEFKEGV